MNFNSKQELTRVEAFRRAHIDKDGNWDNPIVKEQYVSVYCFKIKCIHVFCFKLEVY